MKKTAMVIEVRESGFLVGGEFRTSGRPLEVRSPYDGSLVGITFQPNEKDLEDAIQHAQIGFAAMAALPTYRRAEILRKIAECLEARSEELIRVLALEAGKPRKAGKVEVERAIFNFRNASQETQRIDNEFLVLDLVAAAKRPLGGGATFSDRTRSSNHALPGDREEHAVRWLNGGITDLGTLGGPDSSVASSAKRSGSIARCLPSASRASAANRSCRRPTPSLVSASPKESHYGGRIRCP